MKTSNKLTVGTFQPNSLRSLAAALKQSLIANGTAKEKAHVEGWELARAINKNSDKFDQTSVNRYLSESAGNAKKVTGTQPKAEVELSSAAKKIVANEKYPINEKIRKLFAEDLGCAEIRKALNIPYQRVKNIEKRMEKAGAKKA